MTDLMNSHARLMNKLDEAFLSSPVYMGRDVVMKVLTGSHNYNLNTENSDKDYKLFVCPSFEDLYHGVSFSDGKQSDTLDYTVHDIRKLGELIWKANVNFIEIMYSVDSVNDPALSFIFEYRDRWSKMNLPAFRSACFGTHFQKMEGLFKGTSTTDSLVKEFGYDTKQACHALRMLYTLKRFMQSNGDMVYALWYENCVDRQTLLDVKAGAYTLDEFNYLVDIWFRGYKIEVDEFFYNAQPLADEESKKELYNLIFQFIRSKL